MVGFGLVENVGIVHHLEDLFVVHGFSELTSHVFDLLEIDCPCLVVVVKIEDFE